MALPDVTGRISAQVAAIVPPGAKTATVRQATFEIQPGTTAAILGASGAGKSTLIRGILGIWPTASGEIRIDGAEASSYDRAILGPQVGYLPQDIELLQGTVSENICRFGNIDAEAVIDAAKNAGVHEFILTLPQGYDTQIGGPDGTLSPGQRQRIALARALYRLPKLVILDEPNSNLDDAGEQALSDAIEVLKEAQSTVVVVSHRQRVLPLADVFIVMAHGVVTDYGPSQDVIARVTQNKSNTSHKELPPLASEKQASVAGTTVSGSASKKLRPFNSQTPEKD
jgi:ATP-binding cassette subfamily C protein EexD